MTIEIEEKVALLLNKLRAQAAAHRVPLDVYLEQFVESAHAQNGLPTSEEFDRVLDDLAAGPVNAPSLPIDFSRADIYQDHV